MKHPNQTNLIKHFLKKVSTLSYVVFCLSLLATPSAHKTR